MQVERLFGLDHGFDDVCSPLSQTLFFTTTNIIITIFAISLSSILYSQHPNFSHPASP